MHIKLKQGCIYENILSFFEIQTFLQFPCLLNEIGGRAKFPRPLFLGSSLNSLVNLVLRLFSTRSWMHKLPHELLDDLRLRILRNEDILKVTFATKQSFLKMCYLRHRLSIFIFRWKIIFRSQDIQVFIFLTIPWFTESAISRWVY